MLNIETNLSITLLSLIIKIWYDYYKLLYINLLLSSILFRIDIWTIQYIIIILSNFQTFLIFHCNCLKNNKNKKNYGF